MKKISIAESEGFFDLDNAERIIEYVKNEINAPYVKAEISKLGGEKTATLQIVLSLDSQEDWLRGIFHNSKYSMFGYQKDTGDLEQFQASWSKVNKFRKTKAKSVPGAVLKINEWIKTAEK